MLKALHQVIEFSLLLSENVITKCVLFQELLKVRKLLKLIMFPDITNDLFSSLNSLDMGLVRQ
jgi:hypothetical protein